MEIFVYTGTCNKCGETKPLNLMARTHGKPSPTCVACKSVQSKKWAEKNLVIGKVKSGMEKHPWGRKYKRGKDGVV